MRSSLPIESAASRPKELAQLEKKIAARRVLLGEDDVARNDEFYFCSGKRGTGERESAPDAKRPLLHAFKPKVSFSAASRNLRRYAFAVVPHPENKIARVGQVNLKAAAAGVAAGVANCFVADAIDLVANDRMQLLRDAVHNQSKFHRDLQTALSRRTFKCFGKVVDLRGRGPQRIQRSAPLLRSLRQPA